MQANLPKIKKLHRLALQRGESLSQMAIAWQLRRPVPVTSVIVGVSSSEQLQQNLGALESPAFTPEELQQIDAILQS